MHARRVVIGLIAGLIVGSILGGWSGAFASGVIAVLTPIGQLWVNAIRMTIVPLVVALLFVSVASRDASRGLGRLGAVTFGTFVALLLFAAVVALLIAPPLIADMRLSPEAAAALRSTASAGASGTVAQVNHLPGFDVWVTSLVPANVVSAAADGAMVPVILFTLLFALAARHIEPGLRDALVAFFGAVSGAMTRIVEWVIFTAPVGIFALVVVATSRVGLALAGAMVYYVLAISLLLVLFAMFLYPVAVLGGRMPLPIFSRGVLPAQAVALGSSSSLASLPALVEGARRLALPAQVSGFVLPLTVSTFKVATPITWLMGTLFLGRLYGVTLTTTAMVTIALTGVALSLTIPGVPQGAQLLLAPLLVGYGIPAEGVALLIAVDTIPDLVGTMTNVTGDMVAGVIVARQAVADEAPDEASSANA